MTSRNLLPELDVLGPKLSDHIVFPVVGPLHTRSELRWYVIGTRLANWRSETWVTPSILIEVPEVGFQGTVNHPGCIITTRYSIKIIRILGFSLVLKQTLIQHLHKISKTNKTNFNIVQPYQSIDYDLRHTDLVLQLPSFPIISNNYFFLLEIP